MRQRRAERLPEGETLLGSASARALAAERRRLGLEDEPGDQVDLWGRRIGRGLAWAAVVGLVVWLALGA